MGIAGETLLFGQFAIDHALDRRNNSLMDLSKSLTRTPRAFDPDKGRDVARAVGDVPASLTPLLVGTAGSSPFLASLIEKEAAWLPAALKDVDAAVAIEIEALSAEPPETLAERMRLAKRRIALVVALSDLAGAWTLAEVTSTLTHFADAACQAALKAAVRHQIDRGRLPGLSEADVETAGGMVVIAMGKMGAAELNYSSDIDLICLFDETRFDPSDYMKARAAFARATRSMTAMLSEITAQGYVFRTDLRLRPDPSVTPVCIAMEAAEQYYESLGRTWERAAYIKARPAAGDVVAGARFLKALTPFVWRRHLDYSAIQDAHDMRLAIREHKGFAGPIALPGHDMKLGRGGIREIEFFTQTRQLIAGGRDPDLRVRGTVEGLTVLSEKGWVPPDVRDALIQHYTAHRTVEHRLQMVQDARTHSLPRSEEGFARLAALMDTDEAHLRQDLAERLHAVHGLTEGFFTRDPVSAPTDARNDLDQGVLARWVTYPAMRSARSRQIFERLKPVLLQCLSQTARPNEALLAFDGFLSGLPAGVQLFSLLEANPQLMDLVIDITGTSPALAQYLSRNAQVFDAVIAGDFFSDWPGQGGLEATLLNGLNGEVDYERKLDSVRRGYKEWDFRIGVHLLRGLISPKRARVQYTDLARAVLNVLWPVVTQEFASKHGTPPGRGAVVLGMGSLGAVSLNPGSDLDLIVIYDPLEAETSDGARPLATRPYFARLTQALITALSAPMAQGKLYDVDMRLRPSGNQGPVATSWSAFQNYQRDQAWLWEHLALTRASVVAGPEDLRRDVCAFLDAVLKQPRDRNAVAMEISEMRARIQDAKAPVSLWDIKVGRGRLQELELLAQGGALLAGRHGASTDEGLRDAVAAGLVPEKEGTAFLDAAAFFSSAHTAVRLLSPAPPEDADLRPAAQAFLARAAGVADVTTLETALSARYQTCGDGLDRVLSTYAPKGEDE